MCPHTDRHDSLDLAHYWKPYPEFVAGEPGTYEIIDSHGTPGLPTTGMTDKLERVLYVPLCACGRMIALHELAHVRWSPKVLDRRRLCVPLMVVRAVEDARINRGLELAGLTLTFDEWVRGRALRAARHDLAHDDLVMFLLRAVASIGTSLASEFTDLVAAQERACGLDLCPLIAGVARKLEEGRRPSGGLVPAFAHTVRVARWLARELRRMGLALHDDRDVIGCCGGLVPAGRDRAGRRRTVRLGDGVRPGRLRIVTPPLSIPCVPEARTRGRQRRAASEGTDLRYFHRLFSDQQVFARTVRTPARPGGGSVLIDVSGSMNLKPGDVDRIIAGAPTATTVATYSGDGDRGELRVVVHDGFRATPHALETTARGNVVDLPALQWLAKQPGPRIWISDGGVTGCGDIPTTAIERRCRAVCKEGSIVRVRDARAAARTLARAR